MDVGQDSSGSNGDTSEQPEPAQGTVRDHTVLEPTTQVVQTQKRFLQTSQHSLGQLLVVPHSQLDVSGDDAGLFVVTSSVASQLEHLSCRAQELEGTIHSLQAVRLLR